MNAKVSAAYGSGRQPVELVVVEPHDDSRAMYEEYFGCCGVHLTSVRTGAEALRILDRQVPDAVITCLRLPDMDGFALCDAVHAMPRTTRVPVIAVSSCMPDHLRAVADSTIAMVLMKPCLPDLLLDSIRTLFRRKCPA